MPISEFGTVTGTGIGDHAVQRVNALPITDLILTPVGFLFPTPDLARTHTTEMSSLIFP